MLGAGGILLPYWELKKDCWGEECFTPIVFSIINF